MTRPAYDARLDPEEAAGGNDEGGIGRLVCGKVQGFAIEYFLGVSAA